LISHTVRYFGDIALLGLNTKRTASIRTITNCIVFELKQEDMQKVWESDPVLKMYMEEAAKKKFTRTKSSKEEAKKDEKKPEKAEEGGAAEKGGGSSGSSGGGHGGEGAASSSQQGQGEDEAAGKESASSSKPSEQEAQGGVTLTKSQKRYAKEIEALDEEVPSLAKVLEKSSPPK